MVGYRMPERVEIPYAYEEPTVSQIHAVDEFATLAAMMILTAAKMRRSIRPETYYPFTDLGGPNG